MNLVKVTPVVSQTSSKTGALVLVGGGARVAKSGEVEEDVVGVVLAAGVNADEEVKATNSATIESFIFVDDIIYILYRCVDALMYLYQCSEV